MPSFTLRQVVDVQDQGPSFLNAPYSSTVQENTPVVRSILTAAIPKVLIMVAE